MSSFRILIIIIIITPQSKLTNFSMYVSMDIYFKYIETFIIVRQKFILYLYFKDSILD